MKLRSMNKLLGLYDLLLAGGSVDTGILMINSDYGVFSVYPSEWIGRLPFNSWMIPGIIFIFLFGMGNMIASLASFLNESGSNWILSCVMGVFLLLSFMIQMIALNDCYMATVQFMILSVMQILISFHVYTCRRKYNKRIIA